MRLQFVIQRSDSGKFWRTKGWVASRDLADQFESEEIATDTAQALSNEEDEPMRVILSGPQLVAELFPFDKE